MMIEALQKKYEAEIASARTNIQVYLTNPAGIGEHPDLVSAVDEQVAKLAEAEDKLETLLNNYGVLIDGADDDDDERCPCPECPLKFHREMARWFRELVSLPRAEDGLQGRKSCKKVKAGLRSKSKKGPVKERKSDGKPRVKQGKRRWIPWSAVVQEISASTP